MKHLLKIDTSTRANDSHSRDLANRYEKHWKAMHTDATVTYRDLVQTNIPHVTQSFIEAMFTPTDNRDANMNETLVLSNKLISELKEASTILLSVPMFNFSVPSVLKAYIDNISRVGETFNMDESGYTGLLTDKKLIICAAYGADFSQMKSMDFVEPYLKSLFGFLGFTNIEYYVIEGTSMLEGEELENKKAQLAVEFKDI